MTELDHRWHALLFGVRRSIRYHARREMFFDRFHTMVDFISILSGSAAIAGTLATSKYAAIAGAAVVTVFSTIDLVVGTAKAARVHNDLARDFIALEQRLVRVGESTPTDEAYRDCCAERLAIEAKEPPVLRVLDTLCHNEMLRAEGYPAEQFKKVRWYQRLFANIVDIQEHAIS